MPKHIAIQPGQLYPQPNYSLAVDREGKWTATQVFLCHRNSITRLMPRPGTAHPEIDFISVDTVTAQVSEGDIAEITCNYAGIRGGTVHCGDKNFVIEDKQTPIPRWRQRELLRGRGRCVRNTVAGRCRGGWPHTTRCCR